ncbi:MAG: peptidylprolyl isomerase [Thermofilaceae archaeon]|nr:peptidylprolyl isomerase [Thermofilaceae archaeon]MCX8180710.1 peptidylprolyl isomerase [Thermofilaceae archaeon]MDW8003814.1 peptidylprolyl isomerase [Thermofilaceae archaeon]
MAEIDVKRGDVVLLEYTLIDKDSGTIIETTLDSVAKEAGIYDESIRYGPRLTVIGSGELPPGVEESLEGMREGEDKEVILSPEKAFGRRDPGKVRVIPARELSSRGIIPRVGLEVELKGERGIIISVGSGRTIVDFNHPLAGKEVIYKLKTLKILKNPEEKVKAFLEKHLKLTENVELSISNGDLTLKVPFQMFYSSENIQSLQSFARDIEKFVNEIKTITLSVRLFERKEGETGAPTP